ncbi:uncharacterized protein METZ01_LOCUS413080 [marine metagenome]|uniref:Uncharacterized protein n=1 Tax=marine metagenome TaxID=408172 RepID=A0A382WMT1_9ZZZZ
MTTLLNLIALLKAGDIPIAVSLNGGDVVGGLAIKNELAHNDADGRALHNAMAGESGAVVEALVVRELATEG